MTCARASARRRREERHVHLKRWEYIRSMHATDWPRDCSSQSSEPRGSTRRQAPVRAAFPEVAIGGRPEGTNPGRAGRRGSLACSREGRARPKHPDVRRVRGRSCMRTRTGSVGTGFGCGLQRGNVHRGPFARCAAQPDLPSHGNAKGDTARGRPSSCSAECSSQGRDSHGLARSSPGLWRVSCGRACVARTRAYLSRPRPR
jgi:hypothetical protein